MCATSGSRAFGSSTDGSSHLLSPARRFTRLTNAFSKKLENHACAVSLHFMFCNFARVHQSLKTEKGQQRTPAMVAGIADHVWSVEGIVKLLDPN
jgi:Zn-dependent protease with chaperone function